MSTFNTPLEREQRRTVIEAALDRVFEALTTEHVRRLDVINSGPEEGHLDADRVLLDLVLAFAPAVVDAYERCEKRCGPWWYA